MNIVQDMGRAVPHPAVSDAVIAGMEAETGDARGLPNAAFTDRAFLELERRHLFARTWVFAGPLSDVAAPGSVKCVEVAGRQLFMATDRQGSTRVFFNVCPHRGVRLVIEDQERAATLTCPYHSWTFGLEGDLRARPHYHAPLEHDKAGSKAQRDCLVEVRSAVWHDWVFVNIDGKAAAFDDYMAPATRAYEDWNLGAHRLAHYQPFDFHANWKLVVENFCDTYHVFMVHPGLDEAQTPKDRFAMRPDGVHMFNHIVIGAAGGGLTPEKVRRLPDLTGVTEAQKAVSPFCNLFPNVTMALFRSSVMFFSYEPVDVDRTIMHVWFYIAPEAAESETYAAGREELYANWANLNDEDAGICRRLQEGRSCDGYDGGRFAPYWDAGTLHFHRQVADALRGEGAFAR